MSKEKQITEMKNDLCDIECKGMKCNICDTGCEYRILAEALYNAGYRKQSEGEWRDLPDSGNGWFQNGQRIFPKHCSICGEIYSYASKYNFCPNCGAKMKGGE